MPVPLAFLALFLGLLLARTKRRGLGLGLVALSMIGLLVGGLDFTANMLLAPLERRFPALLVDGAAAAGSRDADVRKVRYIAVLGSGHVANASHPALGQ